MHMRMFLAEDYDRKGGHLSQGIPAYDHNPGPHGTGAGG